VVFLLNRITTNESNQDGDKHAVAIRRSLDPDQVLEWFLLRPMRCWHLQQSMYRNEKREGERERAEFIAENRVGPTEDGDGGEGREREGKGKGTSAVTRSSACF